MIVSQTFLYFNPENLRIYLLTWQLGSSIGARIKAANQLILRWKVDPGLSGLAQCNHKNTFKWRREADKRGDQRDSSLGQTRPNVSGLEGGGI